MFSHLDRMTFLRPSLLDLLDIAAVAFLIYQISCSCADAGRADADGFLILMMALHRELLSLRP